MIRLTFVVILTAIFISVNLQQINENCVCVLYYLCDSNNVIKTTGKGILRPRISVRKCPNHETGQVQVCCKLPENETSTASTKSVRIETMNEECGIRNPGGAGFNIMSNNKRNEANFGEFPWMVIIFDTNENYLCGGSLIHPSVILTAAHCVTNKKNYIARAGDWDLSHREQSLRYDYQNRNVTSKKIHERYAPGSYNNDIALLFLSTPFVLDFHINVICLPSPDFTVTAGTKCYVTGWGSDAKMKNLSTKLKSVELPIVSKNNCVNNLRNTALGSYFNLHPSFICAGGIKGEDACTGDGGGPLVCPIEGQNSKYQQVGIVSASISCGEENVPALYTNVPYLRNWIDKEMKKKNFIY